jgi:hypothetical protein
MSYTPKGYNVFKLTVGDTYFISDGLRIKEAELIHITKRGFNFLDTNSNKILFKRHLYPREIDREQKTLTFILQKNLILDRQQVRKKDIEIRDALMAKTTNKERRELLFNWIRKGHIDLRQFENLIYYIC